MREFLPAKEILLEPSQVYWMSDRVPHESLPMKKTTMRQFFRIMTSEVQFWFQEHYTANPMGVLPDPHATEIVFCDETSEELHIVDDWKEEGYEQMRIQEEKERQENERKRRERLFDQCVADGANRFREETQSQTRPFRRPSNNYRTNFQNPSEPRHLNGRPYF